MYICKQVNTAIDECSLFLNHSSAIPTMTEVKLVQQKLVNHKTLIEPVKCGSIKKCFLGFTNIWTTS